MQFVRHGKSLWSSLQRPFLYTQKVPEPREEEETENECTSCGNSHSSELFLKGSVITSHNAGRTKKMFVYITFISSSVYLLDSLLGSLDVPGSRLISKFPVAAVDSGADDVCLITVVSQATELSPGR